jgi:hypothetical protein
MATPSACKTGPRRPVRIHSARGYCVGDRPGERGERIVDLRWLHPTPEKCRQQRCPGTQPRTVVKERQRTCQSWLALILVPRFPNSWINVWSALLGPVLGTISD